MTTEMTQAEYRAHPGVNQSKLKVLAESPQLYYGRFVSGTIRDSRASSEMAFGTAVEQFLQRGEHDYVLLPPEIHARRGAAYEEFRASLHPGKTVLSKTEWNEMRLDDVQTAALRVRAHDKARAIIDASKWSTRIVWRDHETGLECKAELDLMWPERAIVCDLKTSASPSEYYVTDGIDGEQSVTNRSFGFGRQAINLGYDVQAAWYSQAFYSVYKETPRFCFIVVGNKQPFDCEVYEASQVFMQRGEQKAKALLKELSIRLSTNKWHSATHNTIIQLDAPRWSLTRDGQWNGA